MRSVLLTAVLTIGLACGDDDITLDRCSTTMECVGTDTCINGFCTPSTDDAGLDAATDAPTDANSDAAEDANPGDAGADAPFDDAGPPDGDGPPDVAPSCQVFDGTFNLCESGDRCTGVCYVGTTTITQVGCTLEFRSGSRDEYDISGSATLDEEGSLTFHRGFMAEVGGDILSCTGGRAARDTLILNCDPCELSFTPLVVPPPAG